MASTRNNNMPSDYCLQQKSYMDTRNYNEYQYSQVGRAYNNAIPALGIMPSGAALVSLHFQHSRRV